MTAGAGNVRRFYLDLNVLLVWRGGMRGWSLVVRSLVVGR
jgi:hypothetical protein